MPLQQIEIFYTQTLEGNYTTEVDIPQDVLDDDEKLDEWVRANVTEERIIVNGTVCSESFEIDEITDHGEA